MQRTLIALFRRLPIGLLYGVMALVIPFYMLFGKGFRPSYRFFRKRMGMGSLRSFCHVYLNQFRMGQVVLDRFAAFAGKSFRMEVPELNVFERLSAGDAGFLMLSSHTGCFEMVGYTLHSSKTVHALVYAGETATVMENRRRLFDSMNIRMVPVAEDLSHIFALNGALADGEIVSMPGDRLFGSQKSLRCTFFGEKASFPMGPFLLAIQRQVPVLQVFVMKEGRRDYRVYLSEIPAPGEGTRQERMQRMADAYAARLEEIVRRYPDQWFNFFDFWA